ncbi:hypothetical protein BDN70DRAFT_902173, partial [Pholiota conissans]
VVIVAQDWHMRLLKKNVGVVLSILKERCASFTAVCCNIHFFCITDDFINASACITHLHLQEPILAHSFPFLATGTHSHPQLPILAHRDPFLPTETHSCPQFPILAHRNPFLPTGTYSRPQNEPILTHREVKFPSNNSFTKTVCTFLSGGQRCMRKTHVHQPLY